MSQEKLVYVIEIPEIQVLPVNIVPTIGIVLVYRWPSTDCHYTDTRISTNDWRHTSLHLAQY